MKNAQRRGFAGFVLAGVALAAAGTPIVPAMAQEPDKRRPVVRQYQPPRYEAPPPPTPSYEAPGYGVAPPGLQGFRNHPPPANQWGNEFIQRGPSR